jgi:hypothetical protein
MDTGHWVCGIDVIVNDDTFGFIYEITCTINNKKYIGKKQCTRKLKRKPLKGKKRKRIEQVSSDWRVYTGSSVELNEDIIKYGKEKFTFLILKTCMSKWELGYEEIKEQISRDVLLSPYYYNGILNVRIGSPPKYILENYCSKA